MSDGATISPDPATFVHNWKKEQTVTVTTEDNQTTTYTIVLTKFDDTMKDVLFMDEFDVDGNPDPTKQAPTGTTKCPKVMTRLT